MTAERPTPTIQEARKIAGYGPHDFNPRVLVSRLIRNYGALHAVAHSQFDAEHSDQELLEVYDFSEKRRNHRFSFGKQPGGIMHVDAPEVGGTTLSFAINICQDPTKYVYQDISDMALMATIMEEEIDHLIDSQRSGLQVRIR